ncbi:MAG: anaerobic C4-dicarboxylate transporter family protein [Sutterella wadsworthensis]
MPSASFLFRYSGLDAGSVSDLRPSWTVGEKTTLLPIPNIIQMVMLATAFFIIMLCRVPSAKFASGSVFRSGLIGVVGVFGIAWCTGTFFDQHKVLADAAGLAKDAPFASALLPSRLIVIFPDGLRRRS